MITITKKLIEEMYKNSDNQEVVGSTYDITANSMRMKTELDNDVELQISVYSHYTRLNHLKEMVNENETDIKKIFHTSTFIDEEFTIDCNDEYILTDEAKDYLVELHKEFCEYNKSYDLQLILTQIKTL